MKKVVCHPFYSQQDKVTGEFLPTCNNVKMMKYTQDRLRQDGYGVSMVGSEGLPRANAVQRVHWDAQKLRMHYEDADLALCNHEYMAIPLRAMFPKLKVVQYMFISPWSELPVFRAAWDCADLVVTQSEIGRVAVAEHTATPVRVWPTNFDDSWCADSGPEGRDVDVFFAMRSSVSNYTHHVEFIGALPLMKDLRVQFADPTRYLEREHPDLRRAECYRDVMKRSRVVVAMNDNLYGGATIREAVTCGCIPVVLDAPCYRHLVGSGYQGLVPQPVTPDGIASAVRRVLMNPPDTSAMKRIAAEETFAAGYERVIRDVKELVG